MSSTKDGPETSAPDTSVRVLGLGMGLAIGSIAWATGASRPVGTTLLDDVGAVALAGGVAGLTLAPVAWRARTWPALFGVIVELAVIAVLLGDVAIVGEMVRAGLLSGANPLPQLVPALITAPALAVFGLVVFGPAVFPVAVAAAAFWAIAMVGLRWASSRAGWEA